MASTSVIEIDLLRLDHNIAVLRSIVGPDVGICCVIKADAYGLGAKRIANRLLCNGVQMLAVYTPDQAAELARAGITSTPILVLMPIRNLERTDPLYRLLISGKLHCVVHDLAHLATLIRLADQYGCIIPVHVEIDTGMSRGGLAPEHVQSMLVMIQKSTRIHLAGIFTHFASAGTDLLFTNAQFQEFKTVIDNSKSLISDYCIFHTANTQATLSNKKYFLDMIRVGLAWVGYGTGDNKQQDNGSTLSELSNFKPIFRWRSTLVHIKHIEKDTHVGYGATWCAPRPTNIGLIPVGYADGYPLALSNKGKVLIKTSLGNWKAAPVIGNVSMDQITVDLTDFETDEIQLGTSVELFGSEPGQVNNLLYLAQQANTIVYELLCGLSYRVPRIYRKFEVAPAAYQDQTIQPDHIAVSII